MVVTGLSGNEIFCLNKMGFKPGNVLVGNSVFSLGLLGSIKSGFRGLVGGEIPQYTEIIAEGRNLSLNRLQKELQNVNGIGATGVTSELIFHESNIEFLSIGSTLHANDDNPREKFSSSNDGQELYCQLDSGYEPRKFAFGNVAYSIGIGQTLLGGLKTLVRGEIKEYTDIFTKTRNLALARIAADGKADGANCVIGIETSIIPFNSLSVQEMVMIGTASYNPTIPAEYADTILTSDLTCEEMWNLTNMGYIPRRLVLGTSIYSLGFTGGITSILKSFVKGEINELTTLIYDARESSIGKVFSEAKSIGADDVVGLKTYVYSLGSGLIEFLAIGTAVKYVGPQITTKHEQLLTQAIIRDKDTFFNASESSYGINLNNGTK